ncbi:LOW QUALITY PROTEIN: cactin-like [Pollicipes pollicipes]|uniref:LOW QUALITY PROTEIN: cactin-like n=1 Tax=Pollicipes pollicipes TaxID=41117 RepID=UPI0018857779|nr:LOW QUALITY PROTEIN: cactin-like [Pollicipes pollicipes]
MLTNRERRRGGDGRSEPRRREDVDSTSRARRKSASPQRTRRREKSASPGRTRRREKSTSPRGSRQKDKKKSKKSEKSRKRSSSSSSATSGSDRSASPGAVLTMLEQERARKKAERRRQKEALKARETPEEKRLRRRLKRADKERRQKERMGWESGVPHYNTNDNPFGDSNLLETFRWNKKLQKEGLTDVPDEELEKMNRKKMEENKRELEKVKARRLERERERAERDQEMALLQSKQEAEHFREWEKQEDQFHLRQCSMRSRIRIQEGRAKPIDLLAKYISSAEELDAVEVHEPYTYLVGLSIADLEDLQEDIRVYGELERGENLDFWNDVTVIVEDELQKLRKLDRQARQQASMGRREGIHDAVISDVTDVFRGKTAEQLATLQTQIETKLKNTLEGVDVGYWESLLTQLKAHLARARLRDRHQAHLREKLRLLKVTQGVSETAAAAPAATEGAPAEEEPELQHAFVRPAPVTSDGAEEAEDDLVTSCLREYASGRYSPPLLTADQLEPGTLVADPGEDGQRLRYARSMVQNQGRRVESAATAEEKALQQEAKKGMGSDEARFSVETDLGQQTHLWSDKYRPRKPRYFNRVHTGFEWNKYNQTHYDMDNPPPKIVQGYKFNIFYPDLIDKSKTPEYTLTVCSDNKDFAILRFHVGPPYEDIAFKIVNREWEYSYRRGFRCQFHNNIFQLWFHFKRYRYRR